MARIEPFRGVRYAASDLTSVTAPPYDVISPAEQDALYAQSPHNVVRLILGREADKYQSAARFWQQWLSDGTLRPDPAPSVYVYRQTFADPHTGEQMPERVGLMCLLKLSPYGTGEVFPHEHTLPKHKADRLELTRAAQAQFESIYGLYSDPDRAVQSFLKEYDDREPVAESVPDMIGSSHAIERIADENAVTILQEMFADKAVFIADGHHRYETALNYQKEWRDAHPEIDQNTPVPADFILVTLTAFEDEGLLVLPTHRMVRNGDAQTLRALPQSLAPDFDVSECEDDRLPAELENYAAQKKAALGLFLGGNKSFLLVVKPPPDEADRQAKETGSEAVKRLPVTLLQTLVLERRLNISTSEVAAGEKIAYTRDMAEARKRVEAGEFGAAFVLPRPSVSEVRDVSLAGDVMPQKSTYFFPKLLSGLVLRDLRALDEARPGT